MAERTSGSADETLVRYDNPVLVTRHPEKATSPRPGTSAAGDAGSCIPTEAKHETQEILNAILPPKEWEEDGQIWTQHVSSTPATRLDVVNLQEMLDTRLQQRQARETGICPVRRQLYTQCFDELIRQVTINCAERGLLLLRVRDEARITMEAYQTLYCSSIAFGMRKALQVLTAIRVLAVGSYQRETGQDYLLVLGQTTVSKFLRQFTVLFLQKFLRKYIKFPAYHQSRELVAQGFYEKFGFPNILGCIDCTHVVISTPYANHEAYLNHYGNHSLNVQLSEQGKAELMEAVARLEGERAGLEKVCSELRQKTEQLERRAAELRAAEEKRHQEELLALKKTNAQLKAQLEGIIAPKK